MPEVRSVRLAAVLILWSPVTPFTQVSTVAGGTARARGVTPHARHHRDVVPVDHEMSNDAREVGRHGDSADGDGSDR